MFFGFPFLGNLFGPVAYLSDEGKMKRREFETILLTLESTPALLTRAAAALSPTEARRRPDEKAFSFVENVWHLADLEREGFGLRIRRILAEENPALLNFDGDRLARERCYQERDVERGLAFFARARAQNLDALRRLRRADWKRAGSQEGVGRVTLADVSRMMAEHDRSHGADVAEILAIVRGQSRSGCPRPTSAVA
jgi:DinB superfamily